MTARETRCDWDDKIAQILADPVDAERTPNELAMLEAGLKQRVSLKRLSSDPSYRKRRDQLKLIVDYNEALRTAQKAELPATADGHGHESDFKSWNADHPEHQPLD